MNLRVTHSGNTIPVYREILGQIRSLGADPANHLPSNDPDLARLIALIESKSVLHDDEASLRLFGAKKCSAYKRIKKKLRSFLVTLLNDTVLNSNSEFLVHVLAELNSEYSAYNNLHRNGRKVAATYLGESIISKSIEYGYNTFIPKISAELVEYFSIYEPKISKANKYKKIYSFYQKTLSIEQEAQILYSDLMNMFVIEFNPGNKSIESARYIHEQLSPHVCRIDSIRFHIFFYQIAIFKSYAENNFLQMDSNASEAYDYFSKLKHRRPLIENLFLKKRIEANLILNNKVLCKNLLLKTLENSKEGLSTWYNSLEIFITMELHDQRYSKAILIFLKGKRHRNYDNLIPITKKRWGLLEAYINFLQLVGKAPESPTMSRFRINRFINNTPQYEEDKKGRNIQLIIAQLLFYIIDKNWDKMEEKIDALQKYGTRYLRKNELFRSQVFIRMLLEIPKRMYHPKAILRHTARYRKRLEEMAPNIDLNGSTLEIIPYEDLWELIIQNIVPPKYIRKTPVTTKSKAT